MLQEDLYNTGMDSEGESQQEVVVMPGIAAPGVEAKGAGLQAHFHT